jgi:hypothetical protein
MTLAELLSRTSPALSMTWVQRPDSLVHAISWYRAIAANNWWHIKGRGDARHILRPRAAEQCLLRP